MSRHKATSLTVGFTPETTRAALRHLRRADQRLRNVIEHVGDFAPACVDDPFVALISSVTHQQVSMAAAKTILRRLKAACAGRLSPPRLLTLGADELRACGLSRSKARYVHAIAEAFRSRTLTRAGLREMNDEAVRTATTAIDGIGPWTAEMLLIFSLQRVDVWPVGDLGVRRGLRQLHARETDPTFAEARDLGEIYRPYRTYATWYLWRSLTQNATIT